MKIIFLGGLFPSSMRKEIEENSKGGIDYAADTLQWSIVNGLINNINLKIINLPFVGAYPFLYKKLIIHTSVFTGTKGLTGKNVGFINLPIFKLFFRYMKVKKELGNELIKTDEYLWIVIYSMHSPFLKAAVDIKRKYAKVKLCLIVPDLPEFMSDSRNIIYRSLKYIESKIIKKALSKVDSFVLLSDSMIDALNIKNKPWVRIEGIYNPSDEVMCNKKCEYKSILYSGTLAKRYGIMNLLKAFMMIEDSELQLWICGDGDCRREIERYANIDKRIKYMGLLSREKVLRLQRKATLLVNPRTSNGDYTKYSFPSKTMEYLASGTPCIIHRLQGIPEEYFNYSFVADEETETGLKNMIIEVLNKRQEDLDEVGRKARQFILNQKNPNIQTLKIYNMLKQIEREPNV